jgi:hypothetical protein
MVALVRDDQPVPGGKTGDVVTAGQGLQGDDVDGAAQWLTGTGFSSPRTTPTRGTRPRATARTGAVTSPSCTPFARGRLRHSYNPSRTAIAISAAARRAPRSFRQVRSSMYGWRTSRTRARPASTDTGPLGRSARSPAVISSARSFSAISSVEVISSASAASSGCRTSNSDSRTDRSPSDSCRFQGRTTPSCRQADRLAAFPHVRRPARAFAFRRSGPTCLVG